MPHDIFLMMQGALSPKSDPCETEPNALKKRQKNNVFFQISKKTGFWLLRALSVFSVWYSLYRCAMFLTIYVSWWWISRLTFEKKNGIKKRYFQAIQSPDSKVFKKFVTFFWPFFSLFLFFRCILEYVYSCSTPKVNRFNFSHVVSD